MKSSVCRQRSGILLALLAAVPLVSAQGLRGGGAVNAAAQRPVLAPVAAGTLPRAAAPVAPRPVDASPGLNAQATLHAAPPAQGHGLTVAALASSGATAMEIRTAARANRDAVLAEVDARLEAGGQATALLKRESRGLEGEARTAFTAALDEVKTCQKAVKHSLKAARKAKGDAVTAAQAKLADDYSAYVAALVRAEAAATPATPATPAEPAKPGEEPATPAIPATPATPSVNAHEETEAGAEAKS